MLITGGNFKYVVEIKIWQSLTELRNMYLSYLIRFNIVGSGSRGKPFYNTNL